MVMAVLFTCPAHADDYTYAPNGCELRIVFPEEPGVSQICDPSDMKKCHERAMYARVLTADSSVRITAICTPAEPGMMERYSGDVMNFTLESMAKPYVDHVKSGFNEHKFAKQSVVLGNKKQPDGSETIYMAQLWIGQKSVMTIEGVVTGKQSDTADTLFATILKSVHHESQETPAPPASPEPTENTTKSE